MPEFDWRLLAMLALTAGSGVLVLASLSILRFVRHYGRPPWKGTP